MIRGRRRQGGVTLIELTMAIVIIGIAVVGVLQVMTLTTAHSADPMLREQGQLIAEAYMEEILLKPVADPTTNTVCPAAPALRTNYDNVCDYNGLNDVGARDQFGNAIAALAGYTVTVAVTSAGAVLGTISNAGPPGPGLVRLLRVDITVTGPAGTSVPLTGYRTDYGCNWTTGTGCHPTP
jgi:MSHA pilin protein MshD